MKNVITFLFLLFTSLVFSQENEDNWEKQFVDSILSAPRTRYMGFQAGAGTGIRENGAAFGLGINYLAHKTEIGFFFLSQGATKETNSDGATYTQKNKLTSFLIVANQLFNYNQYEKRTFAIAGIGFGSMDLIWSREKSVNGEVKNPDEDIQEYKTAGSGPLVNIGIGKSVSPCFDVRAEALTLFPFSVPRHISTVLPNVLLSLVYRL
jgi:hypothetical protein